MTLRKEDFDDKNDELDLKYDVWGHLCILYALWVVRIRDEFYKLAA